MQTENQLAVKLPDKLLQQFGRLNQCLWKNETVAAVSGAAGSLGLSYALLFLSDRLWSTPGWLRLLIFGLGLGGAAAFAFRWLHLWVLRPRNSRALARLVQHRYPRLGDRLLGIVELAEDRNRPVEMSPALCRAAIRQVADQAEPYNFTAAVDSRGTRRFAGGITAALGALALVWFMVPQAGWNSFQRWIAPWAELPRFTFVSLEQLPGEMVVPHGEPFSIACEVEYRSFWRPRRATARVERQAPVTAAVADNRARFELPGQTRRSLVTLRVGDAERQIAVVPTHRPALQEMITEIEWPAYLEYPVVEEPLRNGALSLLPGSAITLRGQINRPIVQAEISFADGEPVKLAVEGDRFETRQLNLDGVSELSFRWEDSLGLKNTGPWKIKVRELNDAAPRVEIINLSSETAILETDILPIKLVADDDYGLRDMGLVWQYPEEEPAKTSQRHFSFPARDARQKKMEETWLFNPGNLQIPAGVTVELQAVATDRFRGREPSQSRVYRIHIIGLVRHAELIRQQLEGLFARLEEITRREEAIAKNTRELGELPPDKLAGEETAERAGQEAREQEQTARNLEDIANEGIKVFREALRNPTFDDPTLREWAQTLQAMQNLARTEMKDAANSLQSAQAASADGEQRSAELAKALESEQESLQQLEEMQKRMNQGLDNLQAQTLAQRLRQLAGNQKNIAGHIQKIVPETIGLLPQDLAPRFQRATTSLAGDQEQTRTESQTVQSEMSRFFDRTRRPNYGEVSEAMRAANTGEELDRVRGMIAANISMEAMQHLGLWADRFNKWAEKLEPKGDSAGGGGGGGGGSGGEDQILKQLLAFIRLREAENNIRDRTVLLEQRGTDQPAYAEAVKQLGAAQFRLRQQLSGIQLENELPILDEPLEETFQTMRDVESHLAKPSTDQDTQQTQVKTIAQLSDLINLLNEQAQQNGGGGSSDENSAMEELSFLMQMMQQMQAAPGMGMQPGQSPGGNPGGGGTGASGPALPGDARGSAPSGRNVQKATGTTREVPTEFRDALENYFKALEQIDE